MSEPYDRRECLRRGVAGLFAGAALGAGVLKASPDNKRSSASVQVRSLKLENADFGRQWFDEVEDHWTYDDFAAHQAWKEGWISFDCALYNRQDDRVYLGITCFDAGKIFQAYDRKTDRFVDLGYRRIADRFDAKFHRSLVKHRDGCLYAAPALLHCSDKYLDAPGGAIVKFDPATGQIEKRGIVLPHVYVQALALDSQRETLYCLCFAPEYLASFDLRTGESRNLGLLGSGCGGMAQGENIVLDDDGGLWCNWSLTRAWQSQPGVGCGTTLPIRSPRRIEFISSRKGCPARTGVTGLPRRRRSSTSATVGCTPAAPTGRCIASTLHRATRSGCSRRRPTAPAAFPAW